MALLEWNADLHTGVQDIDEQHAVLVELLNAVHEAVRERRDALAGLRALDELIAYTRSHFAIEERLMGEVGYPEHAEHRIYHEALLDQIGALRQRLDTGEATISAELLDFLCVWLTRHIGESDRRFGDWYATHGRRPAWMHEVQHAMVARRWWQFSK